MTSIYKGLHASQCEAANAKTADFFTYLLRTLGGAIGTAFRTLVVWQKRYNERVQLSQMDSHILKDIGLTEGDRDQELRKPFWRC
jgi:uncharacterized protein YjiS (DUF1127 family)